MQDEDGDQDRAAGPPVPPAGLLLRLLGPVTLQLSDGSSIELGAPKLQILLAALAIDSARPVTPEVLIERIWGEQPPPSARSSLHVLVARLRRSLARVGERGPATGPAGPVPGVLRGAGGYLLDLPVGAVDLTLCRRLRDQASDPGRDRPERAELLGRALGLWAGPPLAGLSGSWPERIRPGLETELLEVAVEWGRAAVALGQHEPVIRRLRTLLDAHPLVEPLTEVLMLALHGAGRSSEAVACFLATRSRLIEELGTEPGEALQAVYGQLLRGELGRPEHAGPPAPPPDARPPGDAPSADEPRADAPSAVTPSAVTVAGAPGTDPSPAGQVVPRELPAAVTTFTGREAELAALDAWLAGAAPDPDAVGKTWLPGPAAMVISAVSGTAGVGKTALAVTWAHRVGHRFPDGHLYVNLRGYDPGQPMTAEQALAQLLAGLGVPARDIPAEPESRAARYRTETAGRRMLIVLDNASSVEQVRPLLPGSPTCVVVITSRDALPGLVARDGARRFDLDLFPPDDALRLLRRLIGPRVDAEPEAAEELVVRCARLPLALRVAAELAISRPSARLADLVAELDGQQRLDRLAAGGDERTAVRAVFSWSVRQLAPPATRGFALLGLSPGADLDADAAAALFGTDRDSAEQILDQLVRAHLVQPVAPGPDERPRFTMHDLLRAYAAELATDPAEPAPDPAEPATDPAEPATGAARPAVGAGTDPDPRDALDRLFDYYLAGVGTAMDVIYPGDRHRRPPTPSIATSLPALDDADRARAWLDAQLPVLTAVAVHAAQHGWPGHVLRLSAALFQYLDGGGHLAEALTIHGCARDVATASGDLGGLANALVNLGGAWWQLGQHARAAEHFGQALATARQAGDRAAESRALINLGAAEQRLGRHATAAEHFEAAIAVARDCGARSAEVRALINLGVVEEVLGRPGAAADHYELALATCRELGDQVGQALALNNLGDIELLLGRYDRAAEHQRQAKALYQGLGNLIGEGWALDSLGRVETRRGRPTRAAGHHREALTMFERIGHLDGQAWTLNGLGEALLAGGEPARAVTHHARALGLAGESRAPDQQARAHAGLARAYRAQGEPGRARAELESALALYTELGTPEAEATRAELDALPAD